MITILVLLVLLGALPLGLGIARLPKGGDAGHRVGLRAIVNSALICAIAFSVTFFWQELWLVLPKALVPGLHPVLYHNDHEWTGDAPIAELLQGCGALATLASGLLCYTTLRLRPPTGPIALQLLFWLAFQGLYQGLTQIAIGTLLPGNDVGRALAFVHFGVAGNYVLLATSVVCLAAAGAALAAVYPHPGTAIGRDVTRRTAWSVFGVAILSVLLTVPFRVPREFIEVVIVPLWVAVIGSGWLILGFSSRKAAVPKEAAPIQRTLPIVMAYLAMLALFQFVLRPGIHF